MPQGFNLVPLILLPFKILLAMHLCVEHELNEVAKMAAKYIVVLLGFLMSLAYIQEKSYKIRITKHYIAF